MYLILLTMIQLLYKEASAIEDILINLRRDFHMHPELGFDEQRTSGKIKEFLDSLNIPYESYAGTGVCGIITGEKKSDESRVIALRADIDALPMQEKNVCEYKSLNEGKMHACGHDAHTAALLGAASVLKKYEKDLRCTIKLIFQPAEELSLGAKMITDSGNLDDVNEIFGLHIFGDIPVGKISIEELLCCN